jgi:glycosyltransferase involved in cell wall biosynthesis
MSEKTKDRILILIVAYNAERTIQQVLSRIPRGLDKDSHIEALIIDDASQDQTFESSHHAKHHHFFPYPLHILYNPTNQGYGGNQKIGYHFAIERGFDFVALLHGDGQYAPECLPDLLKPLRNRKADAVFGSRMLNRGAALKGGMPLYKYIGNKILTWCENSLLGTDLSEFHSGYRIYSVAALHKIPFDLNTNGFHFDTEIIIQFVLAGLRITELPIPTYYGDEICYVNGLKYAGNVLRAALKARVQKMNIFYDRRFDCEPPGNAHYGAKLDCDSTHTAVLARVRPNSRVLDLGCAGGYMGAALRERSNCRVTGCDLFPLGPGVTVDEFLQHDLNQGPPAVLIKDYDYVLMLDVIEHLLRPEDFVDRLRESMTAGPRTELIVTTANVGFLIIRLMLLFGQFNYGKRGILDLTHTRLFTFASLRRLFEQGGFEVMETSGIPAPFSLAVGNGWKARALSRLNRALIKAMPGVFSYQIVLIAKPKVSPSYLLAMTYQHSAERSSAWLRKQQHSLEDAAAN